MQQNILRGLKALFLIFALVFVFGCSKKAGESTDVLSGLARRVPADALGFYTWRTDTNAYRAYRTNPSFRAENSTDSIMGIKLQGGDAEKSAKLIETLEKVGIINMGATGEDPVRQGLVYVSAAPTSDRPILAIILQGAPELRFEEKLLQLRRAVQDAGMTAADLPPNSGSGFSIDAQGLLPPEAGADKFFVVAEKNILAFGSDLSALTGFFADPARDGLKSFIESPDARALDFSEKLPDGTIGAGFLRVKDVAAIVSKKIPAQGPEATALKESPLGAISLTRSMSDSLRTEARVRVVPASDTQKSLLAALGNAAGGLALGDSPSNLAVGLSLSGSTLKALKDSAVESAGPEARASLGKQLDVVDGVQGFTLGVMTAQGASPFPSLLIRLDSPAADSLKATLKEEIGRLTQSAGLPLSPWQSKNIGQTPVDFIMSPLGIGAYLATDNGKVLVSTAEEALQAALDKKANLNGSLSEPQQELLKSQLFAAGYVNFKSLSELLSGVQGSLSMFTGGQANSGLNDQIKALAERGATLGTASIKGDVVYLSVEHAANK